MQPHDRRSWPALKGSFMNNYDEFTKNPSAVCPHDSLAELPTSSSQLSLERSTPMLKVDLASSCLATAILRSGSFLTMFTRVIYSCSLQMSLIPLPCVPFISYQDMENLVLDIVSLKKKEVCTIIMGVFMRSSLPSQLSSLTPGPKK